MATQMSRSVIIPDTFPSDFTTGKTPQSRSHMILTASARFVSGRQVFTSLVMISRTFTCHLLHLVFAPLIGATAALLSDSFCAERGRTADARRPIGSLAAA